MVVAPCVALGRLPPAHAQDAVVSAHAVVANPTSSILITGVREKTDGVWFGGVLQAKFGRVFLAGAGLRGDLTSTGSVTALERDGGELSGLGRFEALSWLGIEVSYTARAFTSAAGYQRWKQVGAGLFVSRALAQDALLIYGRVAYLPWVSVSGLDDPDLAIATETGITVNVPKVPLTVSASYHLHRYDFRGSPDARLEQFEYVALSLGISAERVGGRWTIWK